MSGNYFNWKCDFMLYACIFSGNQFKTAHVNVDTVSQISRFTRSRIPNAQKSESLSATPTSGTTVEVIGP